MDLNNIVGSDTALDAGQVGDTQNSGNDGKVNPGAIRKSATQGILNALSAASGTQFDSVEAAIAYMARTSSQKTNDGNEQPVARREVGSKRMGRNNAPTETNDLKDQFTKLQRELQMKEKTLRMKEIDTEILRSMGDKFDPDLTDYAIQKIKSNIKLRRDGSYAVVNSKGQERYGMDGNPLTLQNLISEVATGNPKLLKQMNSSGGSGLRPGQHKFAGAPMDQIPDYSQDPAAFNAWASKMGLGKGIGLKGVGVSASSSANQRKII